MGRPARAWWNKAKGGWYAELDGRQVRLAKGKGNKAEALAALRALLAARDRGEAAARDVTCSDVFVLFLADCRAAVGRGERRPVTLEGYKRWLLSAEAALGPVPAARLRPRDVTAWLDAHPGWGATSRSNAVTAAKAAFRWARRQGHVEADPLADLERPTPRRRQVAMGAARVDQVLAGPGAARVKGGRHRPDPAFTDLLVALADSGCRPGEVFGLTAAMADAAAGVWRVPNKTEHATGEQVRVVHLTPRLAATSARLAAAHPEGPIFRNARGGAWNRNAVACRFARLRAAGRATPGESPYAIRHGFATDALEAGVPVATVAELLGHKDVAMISRVYGHLGERVEHLREAIRKARPGETGQKEGPGE